MGREPLLTRSTVVAVVTTLLAVLTAFGLPISDTQQNAVLGAVGVIAPIVLALWARRRVTPIADPRDDDGTPLTRDTEAVRMHVTDDGRPIGGELG